MRLSSRGNIHLALPRAQNSDREMRGRTEAKQSDALARLDAGNAQAAEADDSGAEERGGVQIVECSRQRKDKVGAGQCIFRVSAGDAVSGERGRVAEVLRASFAIGASAIRPAEPANAGARAEWDFLCGAADYFTDNLMAWDHARLLGRQI